MKDLTVYLLGRFACDEIKDCYNDLLAKKSGKIRAVDFIIQKAYENSSLIEKSPILLQIEVKLILSSKFRNKSLFNNTSCDSSFFVFK